MDEASGGNTKAHMQEAVQRGHEPRGQKTFLASLVSVSIKHQHCLSLQPHGGTEVCFSQHATLDCVVLPYIFRHSFTVYMLIKEGTRAGSVGKISINTKAIYNPQG